MVELPRPSNEPKASALGPEYNAFLYATIGTEPNGNALTLLSAMARMDLDPWQEAMQLSQLSVKAAGRKLAVLIAAMSVQPTASGEPAIVAERLVKLLPRSNGAVTVRPLYKTVLAVGATSRTRAVLFVLAVLIALAVVPVWSSLQRSMSPPHNNPAHSESVAPPK